MKIFTKIYYLSIMYFFQKRTYKLLLVACFLFAGFKVYTQEIVFQKIFKPIAAKSYGIEDGLLWNCVLTADIEESGILDIIPCIHVQNTQGLYFFKFDGFRSYPLNPPQVQDKSSAVIVPSGFNSRGNLYGFIADDREYPKQTQYFEFDQQKSKWNTHFVTTANGDTLLIYNLLDRDGVHYFLGALNDETVVMAVENEVTKSLLVSDTIELQGPAHARPPLLISKDYIWTKNWNNTVRKISRRTGVIKDYKLPNTDVFSPIVPDKIFEGPDNRIFITIHAIGKVFEFNKDQDRFVSFGDFEKTDSNTENVYCYRDEKSQLLFVHQFKDGELLAYILRENGIKEDYTAVSQFFPANPLSGLRNVEIYSKDFENKVFVLGSDFISIEVQSTEAIEAIPASDARGFFYPEDGKILISAAGLYDLNSNILTDPKGRYCTNLDLRGESDMVTLPNGNIIRGMLDGQISVYDPARGSCQVFKVPGDITRMTLADEDFLIAIAGNKLGRLDLEEFIWSPLLSTEIPGFINSLKVLNDGTIAIASSSGFFIVSPGIGQLEQINIGGNQDEQQILSIFENETGKVLLGTFRQGLKIWDRSSRTFDQIDESAGLSNNTVASIIKDKDGDFWLGTFNGIGIIDSEYNLLGHVYELDGLIDNECNRWSSGILRDGRLFFGTPEGFSLIKADLVKKSIANRPNPQIYLTQLEFNDQQVQLEYSEFSENGKPTVILPANNRNLFLSYGLSSYASVQQNTFEYKIDKEGNRWNFAGSIHDLNINNLPPGQYNILIRGTDYRGRQSSNILSIPVLVRQYFFKTWWFISLIAVLILSLVTAWLLRLRNEKRRLEAEVIKRTRTINQQAEDLRELDKAKTRLFTNISHEFRTPLTVILGLADKSKEDKKAPEMIKRNANNLLNLVNQILDLRKLESGKMELTLIQSDVNRYLAYISESMKSLAESNSLQFHYLAPQGRIMMDFDADKLMKIVVNLISNAVKFTPEGGNIYVQLEQFDLPEEHISFKVKDTGIGIDEKDQEKIFNRFHQLDIEKEAQNKTQFQGTGIGLTLVKTLVDLMDGEIDVESTPGNGATFTVKLPVKNIAKRSEPAYQGLVMTKQERNSEHTMEVLPDSALTDAPLVLVVDDNPDILHYVQSCLQSFYNIELAHDGQEGIEKAIELVPDLIISDVMMPLKDGLELCETLKTDNRTSHIPIIMLTAKADIESRLEGLSRGADAYLAKPFNEQELLLNIEKMIALRENLRKRYSSEQWIEKQSEVPGIKIEDSFLLRFREILFENIENEDWSVSDMTEAMLVSRTQLHNKIKALTGRSVSQFMRSIRLAEAKKLLMKGQFNISQVAYEVGFKDPKYFSRVFKEEYGESPTEWASK